MTQKELVLKYLKEYPFIIPAKNLDKSYGGGFFGAELSRVCRKMRAEKILESEKENGLEKYRLVSEPREESFSSFSPPPIDYSINGIAPRKVEKETNQAKLI
jgi:hypothetical protein